MQLAISYVISHLSKIADVDPSSVESSLLNGFVRIRDMRLRSTSLNSSLPFPIRSGHIDELSVQIPWPASGKPLVLRSTGVTLTLETNGRGTTPTEMSLEDIRLGITEESILGAAVGTSIPSEHHREREGDVLMQLESTVMEGENLWTPPLVVGDNDGGNGVESEDDRDDDYMSCHSGGESSTVSFDSFEDATFLAEDNAGLFSFLRTAASNSVSWIMDRPIHVHLTDVSIIFPCDSFSEMRAEAVVNELQLQFEPSHETATESMKVVTITLSGITLRVCGAGDSGQRIVAIDGVSVRITSVYNASGVLCRKNTAIVQNGETLLFVDEEVLHVMLRFLASYRVLAELPEYCRPFADLRRRPHSRWLYAKRCVLALVQDRQRRYNLNPSHLHFYAEARSTYLSLLDYCHRTRDVTEKRDDLAEVEHDLRYPDVVLFLRLKAQERHSVASSSSSAKPKQFDRPMRASDDVVVASSIHLDVTRVCVCLPAQSMLSIRNLSFVSRLEEMDFSLGDVILKADGKSQSLRVVTDVEPLFSLHCVERNGTAFATLKASELRLTANSAWTLQIVQPLVSSIPQLLEMMTQMRFVRPSPPPRQCMQTTSVIISSAHVCFDDLLLHLERLSLTVVERSTGGGRRIGVLMKELYVQFGTEDLVLEPMQIQMNDSDDVVVSMISVNVRNALWTYFSQLRNKWESVVVSMRIMSRWMERMYGAVTVDKPTSASLDDMDQVSRIIEECKPILNSQRVTVLGAACVFQPLKLHIKLGRVDVSQVATLSKCTALHLSIPFLSILTNSVEGGTFMMTLPVGLVCVATSWKNNAAATVAHIDMVDASWRGVVSQLTLLHASGIRVSVCGNLTCCSAESARLLEAVMFGAMRLIYRQRVSSVPTTTRPYLASSLQVHADLVGVYINSLARVEVGDVIKLMTQYTDFLVKEVISVMAYQLFFSGLSDIAVVLRATPCRVYFDDFNTLVCQISMSPGDAGAVDALLADFGDLLPEMRDASPLTILNDCDMLALRMSLPLLQIEVYHSCFSSLRMTAILRSSKGTISMGIQEFWEPSVRMIKPTPMEFSVFSFVLGAFGVASLEVEALSYTQGGAAFDIEGDSMSSDSAFGSDESSVILEDVARVEVKGCSFCAQATPAISMLGDARRLRLRIYCMMHLLYRRHVVRCDWMRGERHDLSVTGPWFFDCPGKIVLVEDCTFIASGEDAGMQMVVCRGSHVYFRRSRFSSSLLRGITVEDGSASFVCDECEEIEPDVNHVIPLEMQENTKQMDAHKRSSSNNEKKKKKKKKPPPYRLHVMIHHGGLEVELIPRHVLLFALSAAEMQFSSTSQRRVMQVRLKRGKCESVEDDMHYTLFSRLEFDADIEIIRKKQRATLNAAIRTGGVSIPISLLVTAGHLSKVWDMQRWDDSTSNARIYTLPHVHREFAFTNWKGLITTSVIPAELCLPTGIPFMKLILVNAAAWSKKEVSEEEASVEAQLGVQEFSIWDAVLQAHTPLLQKPLLLLCVCRAVDLANISCDVSMSPLELFLSSDQIKSSLSLLMSLRRSEERHTTCCYAMEMVNQSGIPVTLEGSMEQFVMHDRLTIAKKHTLSFPHCVRAIGGESVCHFEKFLHTLPDEEREAELFHTVDIAVLENGERIFMVTRILEASLTQQVTFRTFFHVMNLLPRVVVLFSSNGGDEARRIPPRKLSCIPHAYLNSKNVVMCLASADGQCESKEVRMWSHTPRDVLKAAEERGDASIGQLKEFAFADEVAYVDITYRLQGSHLTMFLAATRPTIHNDTRFTLGLSLLIDETLVESSTIGPGKTFVTMKHDPFGPQLQYLFECRVHAEAYVADERVDLSAIDPVVGESIVMKHEKFPRRYFFELSIQRRQAGADGPALVLSVCPRHMFLIENNTLTDAEITSESGDSVGTLGGNLLLCTPGRNFAYLPLHMPLVLRAEKANSSPFEVSEQNEERLLLCTPFNSSKMDCVLHCFVLRARGSGSERVMELLPALFLVNMDAKRHLFVKHIIRKGDEVSNDEWVHHVVVPASSKLPHTVLSRYGYSDLFSFAWGEDAAETEYSAPIKVTFSPKTNWTGFVQCDQTHHAVQVRKEGSSSAAVLAVSSPQKPYLDLVNMTPLAYSLVDPMTVCSRMPSFTNNDNILLRCGNSEARIQLTHNMSVDVGDGVTAFVRKQHGTVTVVLSHLPVNAAVPMLNRNSPAFVFRAAHEAENSGTGKKTLLRVDAKIAQFSVVVQDGDEQPIRLVVQSSEFWFVYQLMKFSAQCSLSNLCIQSTYNGKKRHVIKPFCLDMTLRDVEVMTNAICALSMQINVTQLELELSDVLVFQLQQLAHHCQPQPVDTRGGRMSPVSPAVTAHAQLLRIRRIQVESVVIFDVCVIVTYDRSVRPPKDVLFRGSSFAKLIPSLHHATINLPIVRFRDISCDSVAEVVNIIREALLIECLKQIPKLVTNVVLFPSLSPLGTVLTRVGSFIFGSSGSSPDLPGTALI